MSSDLDRKLLVIDPKARKVTHAIDTEGTTHWIGILPNGSKIYATNKNDGPFISVIDLKTHKMTGKIPVPGGTPGNRRLTGWQAGRRDGVRLSRRHSSSIPRPTQSSIGSRSRIRRAAATRSTTARTGSIC